MNRASFRVAPAGCLGDRSTTAIWHPALASSVRFGGPPSVNAANAQRWAFRVSLLTVDGLGLNVSEEIQVSKKGPAVESVYKVVELVGTSSDSWEKAASAAVAQAGRSLRDLRVAEVSELDLTIEDGKIGSYRAKVKLSFKYEGGD